MSLIASSSMPSEGQRINAANSPPPAPGPTLGVMAAKTLVKQFDFKSYASAPVNDVKADSPQDFEDKVMDLFYGGGQSQGALMPWSKTFDLVKFRDGESSLWAGYNGHGKALALDTPILTGAGWSTMGELKVGDTVFDENGKPCNIVAVTEVMNDRPCYEVVFSDGSKIVADENHEWLTTSQLAFVTLRGRANALKRKKTEFCTGQRSARGPSIVTTKKIAETQKYVWKNGQQINNHAIPVAGAIEMPDADLPIPPYVLGAWLGDGTSADGSITSPDGEVLAKIESHGYRITKHSSAYGHGIIGLATQLRALGLRNNKHIPQQYLSASIEQRQQLLMGLMDTDGCVMKSGVCEFTNTNKSLAEGALHLALSLGILAKMAEGTATLYGKDCGPKYRVTFTTNIPVFDLERKAKLQKTEVSTRARYRFITEVRPVPSVPVRCIQVDSESHLYLASTALIPTHNSQVTTQIGLDMAWANEIVVIGSFEMAPERTLWRMIRQASRSRDPGEAYIRNFLAWAEGRIWLLSKRGTVDADWVIAAARYSADTLKANQFFVDNLAKCVKGEDDFNGQKDFVDQICTVGMDTGMHMHLIHHLRKGADEMTCPGKMEIKGSGSITDQVDNVAVVWRNKRKEEERAQRTPKLEIMEQPDSVINVCKQRNGESWEGKIGLWFDPESMSYAQGKLEPSRVYDVRTDIRGVM